MTDDEMVDAEIPPMEPVYSLPESDVGEVTWDISRQCVIGFAVDPTDGLYVYTAFSRDGRRRCSESRKVTRDQLTAFGVSLIRLAGPR